MLQTKYLHILKTEVQSPPYHHTSEYVSKEQIIGLLLYLIRFCSAAT